MSGHLKSNQPIKWQPEGIVNIHICESEYKLSFKIDRIGIAPPPPLIGPCHQILKLWFSSLFLLKDCIWNLPPQASFKKRKKMDDCLSPFRRSIYKSKRDWISQQRSKKFLTHLLQLHWEEKLQTYLSTVWTRKKRRRRRRRCLPCL